MPIMVNKNDIQTEKDEIKLPYASCTLEARDKVEAAPEMNPYEDSSNAREKTTLDCSQEENEKKLKGPSLVSEQHESTILNMTKYASTFVESNFKVEVAEEACETEENLEELQSAEMGIRSRKSEMIEAVDWEDYDENEATGAQLELQQDANEQTIIQVPCEPLVDPLLSVAVRVPEKENGGIGEIHLNVDMKEKYNIFNVAQEVLRRVVNKDVEAFREAKIGNGERKTNSKRRAREVEAHERSVAEAREKVERIAVERVTAEARQRALAEAREKAEKASAEALERSLADKSARESRLRAERAAVERATAEARERAAERALAEKAAADARERAEKLNAASTRDKMRRGNETEAHSRARFKADSGTRDTPDLTHDMQYKNQRHMDSYNHGEGESALRCKARLERHQRTVEHAAKALVEKNTRDILAQREQAERNVGMASSKTETEGEQTDRSALLRDFGSQINLSTSEENIDPAAVP